jgi:hypothetical protein
MSNFASESGHWYTKDGEPLYEVPSAKGVLRPTTLRDARKLNLVPAVTTIMKELAAPQLEAWKIKEALLISRAMRKSKGEDDEAFALRVMKAMREKQDARSEIGSRVHGAIERAMLGYDYDPEFTPHVDSVCTYLEQLEHYEAWNAERSFANARYGGKVDLHSDNWVIDFKTKEFGPEDNPMVYDNHFMQLGAYRQGLGIPNAQGMIIYVSISHPGVICPVSLRPEELERGERLFEALVNVWQIRKGYYPDAQ